VSKPMVFVALPEYGGLVSPDSREAYYCRSDKDSRYIHAVFRHQGSLLANCFNHCWCKFANSMHMFDYFVMLHSDVAPSDDWMRVLIAELEASGYDLMHAVSPIKDRDGMSSTALGHSGKDRRFESKRRIALHEAKVMLPDTFGTEQALAVLGTDGFDPVDDLCLMPNTGCMVIRRSEKWREFPGFQIHDALVRTSEGELEPAVMPEDWELGAWCHRNGLRVGATTKVDVRHAAVTWYDSTQQWGYKTDPVFFRDRTNGKQVTKHGNQRHQVVRAEPVDDDALVRA